MILKYLTSMGSTSPVRKLLRRYESPGPDGGLDGGFPLRDALGTRSLTYLHDMGGLDDLTAEDRLAIFTRPRQLVSKPGDVRNIKQKIFINPSYLRNVNLMLENRGEIKKLETDIRNTGELVGNRIKTRFAMKGNLLGKFEEFRVIIDYAPNNPARSTVRIKRPEASNIAFSARIGDNPDDRLYKAVTALYEDYMKKI